MVGETVAISLADIHLRNIGGADGAASGASPDVVADAIVAALVEGVVSALNGFDDPLEYALLDDMEF